MPKKPSSCIVPGLCRIRRTCLSRRSNYGSSNWYIRDKILLFPHWCNGCLGHVCHALSMKAMHGGKAKNDTVDAQKIAVVLRGGMLPQAYVYPAELRATRDLLRRRMHLTLTRT